MQQVIRFREVGERQPNQMQPSYRATLLLLTKTEYIMTAEEKETLQKLTEKYLAEDKDAPSWGIEAAQKLHTALSTEYILNNGFRA